MRAILTASFFLFIANAFSQDLHEEIMLRKGAYIYEEFINCRVAKARQLQINESFLLLGKKSCKSIDYAVLYKYNNYILVERKDISIDSLKWNNLDTCLTDLCTEYAEYFNFIKQARKLNIAITDSYASNECGTVGNCIGAHISILNLSKKKIKYIWFNVIGYNPVDDKVLYKGSYTQSLKGIGPIEAEMDKTMSFSNVWYDEPVSSFKINSMKIQYMDGTTISIDKTSITKVAMSSELFLDFMKIKLLKIKGFCFSCEK